MKAERLSRDKILQLACLCLVLAMAVRLTAPTPGPAPASAAALLPPLREAGGYGFGGHAVRGAGTPIDLGQRIDPPAFALVADASASQELVKSSCLTAAPGVTAARPPAIADDLPGFYGAPWLARLNGLLVALLRVSVPRDPLRPPVPPTLQVYARPGGATPMFSATPGISVYRGSRAVLYRVFGGGPVRCIDLVVPNGAGVGTGYVYYPVRGGVFEARGSFTIQR